MTSDHWEKLQAIFIAALQRESGERVAFTREACGGDAALQVEVESLLRSHDDGSIFLNAPALGADAACRILRDLDPIVAEAESQAPASGDASDGQADGQVGYATNIGRYRILRLVGEGGMGSVYEAEQAQPRRIVALKVIKPGLVSPELMRRFRQESQALARLQHPGIAQIYEAGEEDRGAGLQLFFAMEFIRGEQLMKYADAHHLKTRERLELTAKVCEAVHHAHERGLIHRDLKPGNILVDEVGQPKILDFGVARVTGGDVEATHQTDVGQLLGTVAYMSPEQVLGDPLALDRRSDVYALGVILYELLAGRLPYHISPRMHEALRAVQEDDPKPLSSISRSYRGDVETIVATALAKDKTRRYPSAADLAEDIRRYLQNEPIIARPGSAIYQLQKFARRHKALVAGVFAVFVALLGGVIVSTEQAMRARQAERAALNEAATAKAVTDFLENDLLAQASAKNQSGPAAKPDPDLKVRTALDRAAASIGGKFDRQPQVEAAIRNTIGQTYVDLGLYTEARNQQERALELYRRTLGTDNPATLTSMRRLGEIARFQGKYPQAETLLNQTLQIQRRLLGADHPDTAASMNILASVYNQQGKYPQAEALLKYALQVQRRELGSDHPDTLASMNILASVYGKQGKYAQAEFLNSQVLAIRRRLLGPEYPSTLASMNNLANDYYDQGKYAQAELLDSQVLEIRRRLLGPEHPDTLSSMNNLANAYYGQGKYAQAGALYARTLEIRRRVLGPEHPSTLSSMSNLANDYNEQGKYAEAEVLASRALRIQRRVLRPDYPDTLASMNNLADAYYLQGKYTQAEALLKQTLDIRRRVLGPAHPDSLSLLSDMAGMYEREGEYGKAESAAAQALAGKRQTLGPDSPDTMDAAADLALVYQSEGKFAGSEPLAREALEFNRKKRPDDWQRFRAESLLGASLAGQGKFVEAEPLLLEGYKGMAAQKERIAVPDRYHLHRAVDWIIELYVDWDKPEKAAEWRKARTSF